MKYPKLFKEQPEITEREIARLTKEGFLVSETSVDSGDRRNARLRNPTAGDVVGYSTLSSLLTKKPLSQDDARRLLVLESCRVNGQPRQSHVVRFLNLSFNVSKKTVIEKLVNFHNGKRK